MINLPGIVLIDDNKGDLDMLQDSLIQAGYPCFPIHYKNNDPNNITGIDHVNLEKIKPRIVITDINLQEQNKLEEVALAGPIASILGKLTLDGPYILYFWSQNASHVDGIMEYVFERFENIPPPIHYGLLDKTKLKVNPLELENRIKDILLESPIFNALFSWENRVSSAAQDTTNSLFNLAQPTNRTTILEFQKNTNKTIGNLLSIIGNETLGIKNAKEEPGLAIDLGLEPVLHDHIRSNSNHEDKDNDDLWRKAANKIGQRSLLSDDTSIKPHLNTFYHIEEVDETISKNKRGIWIAFKEDYLKKNKDKITKNLGRKIKTLLYEEFLNCKVDADNKDKREEARSNIKLGFIELSAECDQAQRKTKLNRYFLSAMIPVEYKDNTIFDTSEKPRDTAHSGIYRLPNVIVNSQEYIIKVSFMYQIGTHPDSSKWLGKPIFRLKDQILSDISFRASQHLTRPGIIRFD